MSTRLISGQTDFIDRTLNSHIRTVELCLYLYIYSNYLARTRLGSNYTTEKIMLRKILG